MTKDELINLVVTIFSYKKEPLVSTKIEEKTDEILKEAEYEVNPI
jgi:hypothetical protein